MLTCGQDNQQADEACWPIAGLPTICNELYGVTGGWLKVPFPVFPASNVLYPI